MQQAASTECAFMNGAFFQTARPSLFFFDELATVGITFSFENGGAEIGVIDKLQGRFFYRRSSSVALAACTICASCSGVKCNCMS
jgi:hypothetical protein